MMHDTNITIQIYNKKQEYDQEILRLLIKHFNQSVKVTLFKCFVIRPIIVVFTPRLG